MHSASAANVTRTARRASDSPPAHLLARAGLTARGVIYILVGWVALLVALGQSSREADQQGALHLLAGKSYGMVSLWLLGIGFAAYALWRLSEAAFGVTGEPPGAGPPCPPSSRSRREGSSASGSARRSATSSTAARARLAKKLRIKVRPGSVTVCVPARAPRIDAVAAVSAQVQLACRPWWFWSRSHPYRVAGAVSRLWWPAFRRSRPRGMRPERWNAFSFGLMSIVVAVSQSAANSRLPRMSVG